MEKLTREQKILKLKELEKRASKIIHNEKKPQFIKEIENDWKLISFYVNDCKCGKGNFRFFDYFTYINNFKDALDFESLIIKNENNHKKNLTK